MNFYLHNFNYRRGEKCFMSYNRVHICMDGIIILHKIYSRSLRCVEVISMNNRFIDCNDL